VHSWENELENEHTSCVQLSIKVSHSDERRVTKGKVLLSLRLMDRRLTKDVDGNGSSLLEEERRRVRIKTHQGS